MSTLSFQDNIFLLTESENSAHHISGLFVLKKPSRAASDFVSNIVDKMRSAGSIDTVYGSKLKYPSASLQQEWVNDKHFDIDYHLRHYRLPAPGNEDQLMRLVNTLHSHRLDLHRPLWEYHIIDGLKGNRFAIFAKQHHAIIDGAGSIDLLNNFFSEDKSDHTITAPWAAREAAHHKKPSNVSVLSRLISSVDIKSLEKTFSKTMAKGNDLIDLSRLFYKQTTNLFHGKLNTSRLPLSAPKTVFNGSPGPSRASYMVNVPIRSLNSIAKRHNASLNDVFMAISGDALREYMNETDTNVKESIVAMVPVSLASNNSKEGNRLGVIHCAIGTEIQDPEQRLAGIKDSMDEQKADYQAVGSSVIKTHTNLMSLPALGVMATGLISKIRPTYNIVISNVPGPSKVKYLGGAKLERFVPMSVIFEGSTLNITGISYAGNLQICILACPTSVPNAQSICQYFTDAVDRLAST